MAAPPPSGIILPGGEETVDHRVPLVKFRGSATPLVLVWDRRFSPLVRYASSSKPRQVPHTGKWSPLELA